MGKGSEFTILVRFTRTGHSTLVHFLVPWQELAESPARWRHIRSAARSGL